MKRSLDHGADTQLTKRRRVVKELRSWTIDETFGEYDIKCYEESLERAVEKLEEWGEDGDKVRERGEELATLMRDTIRWHRDRRDEHLKEFDRLSGDALLARSEEHVNVTKEIFGGFLDRGEEIALTVREADREIGRSLCDDTMLEIIERATKELDAVRDTCYGAFDSDQMNHLLRVCCEDDFSAKWCRKMKFWK